MPRIVSLIPSATEIVAALGMGASLVGRSHECDYPAAVKRLPALTEPRFNPHATSAVLDERVKEILEQTLSVYRVDAARLRELAPDVIVTQTQCEVCAVSPRDVEQALAQWLDGAPGVDKPKIVKPKIVSMSAATLEGVMDDISRAGQALGAEPAAAALVADLRARMRKIAARTASLPTRPRVCCIEWIKPLMSAGNWMPELVAMAGGQSLLAKAGEHTPYIGMEQLAASAAEVIVVAPCGFDMERTLSEMPALVSDPLWATLPAVKAGRVYVADGNQYFNRPGPRLVESLEILAELIHPEALPEGFSHRGTGWHQWLNTGRARVSGGPPRAGAAAAQRRP